MLFLDTILATKLLQHKLDKALDNIALYLDLLLLTGVLSYGRTTGKLLSKHFGRVSQLNTIAL